MLVTNREVCEFTITAAFLPNSALFVYSFAIVKQTLEKEKKKKKRSAAVELLKGPVHLEPTESPKLTQSPHRTFYFTHWKLSIGDRRCKAVTCFFPPLSLILTTTQYRLLSTQSNTKTYTENAPLRVKVLYPKQVKVQRYYLAT